MISFNISCEQDHEFEAWFQNSDAFQTQRRKKLIACPVCGSRKVEKALSAPNIATSESRDAARREKAQALQQMVTVMRQKVRENCDNVGERFPEEARKIHYGEADERGIYGKATQQEAMELLDEGIEVNPIPWMEESHEN